MPRTNQHTDEIEKAIAKYNAAIDKNTSESEIIWSRFNAMLFFNSVLITAIGLTYQESVVLPYVIILFLPVAGLFSCLVWFISTLRGFQWVRYWIVSARKIEKEYLLDSSKVGELDPINRGNEVRGYIVGWPRTEVGSYFLIIMIGILYIVFLYYTIIDFPSTSFYSDSKKTQQQFKSINHNDKSARDLYK